MIKYTAMSQVHGEETTAENQLSIALYPNERPNGAGTERSLTITLQALGSIATESNDSYRPDEHYSDNQISTSDTLYNSSCGESQQPKSDVDKDTENNKTVSDEASNDNIDSPLGGHGSKNKHHSRPRAKKQSSARRHSAFYDDEIDGEDRVESVMDSIDKLPEIIKSIVKSVLDGQISIPPNTNARHIKKALQSMAGTIELQDPVVAVGFNKLNGVFNDAVVPSSDIPTNTKSDINQRKFRNNLRLVPLVDVDFDRSKGACLGLNKDIFFISRGESPRPGKEVCANCIVKTECLDFALKNKEKHGIWGGMSEFERKHMRRYGISSSNKAEE